MKLSDMARLDNIEPIQEDYEDADVIDVYTSDLLSDVMANAKDGSILITIQAHNNTVAVASLAGVIGILVCSNRPIPEDMIVSARQEKIAIFRTAGNQFTSSCLLGKMLIR